MVLYILRSIWRKRDTSILASTGFFLVACTLILLSAATQTTVLQAQQTITGNWHSAYDLIVLPPKVPISGKQVIPGDLLSAYNGGISISQYQQIKALRGVSVAASIATIGYLDLPTPVIHLLADHASPGYYREMWTQSAFNGKQEIVGQQTTSFLFLDDPANCHFSQNDTEAVQQYNDRIASYAKEHISYFCTTDGFSLSSPYGLHIPPIREKFLLTAIDPTQENKLVHLDSSVTQGRTLNEQDTAQLDNASATLFGGKFYSYQLPILVRDKSSQRTTLHLQYARLRSQLLTLNQLIKLGGTQWTSQTWALPFLCVLLSSEKVDTRTGTSAQNRSRVDEATRESRSPLAP